MEIQIKPILSIMESSGHAVTCQRRMIIEELCAYGDVDDVEEFWLYLRGRDKCISLATVHSTLNVLARAGLMEKVALDGRKVGYRF